MPEGKTDANLSHFSIDHDYAYIIPVLKEILEINPNLWIVSGFYLLYILFFKYYKIFQ